ncbi:MAG: hypothetical protein IJ809_05320 [Clostridia bacterium]|nr:hypothetical protein [Clostridia bacterium]
MPYIRGVSVKANPKYEMLMEEARDKTNMDAYIEFIFEFYSDKSRKEPASIVAVRKKGDIVALYTPKEIKSRAALIVFIRDEVLSNEEIYVFSMEDYDAAMQENSYRANVKKVKIKYVWQLKGKN